MRFGVLGLVMGIVAGISAEAADPPPVYLDPPPLHVSSHVINRSSVRPARGRVYDLVRERSQWRFSEVDELVQVIDAKQERVLIDESARTAWLVVDRDVPEEIPTGVVGRSGQPAHMWRCREAMSDSLKDRARFGYSPCNSYFSRQQILRRLPDRLTISQINTEQLYQAIEESGLLFVLDNRYSDRRIYLENRERLNLYRREFARADTEERLEAFITRYREDDPDRLVQRAEERLKMMGTVKQEAIKQENERTSYLESYAQARSSKDYQQFIERYRNNDPMNLVPHAERVLELLNRPAVVPAPVAPAVVPAPAANPQPPAASAPAEPAPPATAPANNPPAPAITPLPPVAPPTEQAVPAEPRT